MYIKYSSPKEIPENSWTDLLKSGTANFFHTPEAISYFESCGIETFIYAVEREKKLTALITGIIQKEKGRFKSFFTRRAIVFGGPIFSEDVSSKEITLLFKGFIELLGNKAIYIEIRNLNDYSKYRQIIEHCRFSYQPHLNYHVNCVDEALIRKNMSKSKLRQVKKSLKTGAEIIEANDENDVKQFYTILKNLYQTKVKTPLFAESFFLNFFYQKTGKYFLIRYKDKIIGGIMCPIFKNRVIYEWFVCGEDGKYKGVYPSILSTWAAIEYANKNEIAYFDFMGAGSPDKDYGVREFKSKFGGELVEHGRFLYIVNPFLYWLGKNGIKLLKKIK